MTRLLMTSLQPSKSVRLHASKPRRCCHATFLAVTILFAGCRSAPPKPAEEPSKKPTEPAVPEDIQDAAHALLGSDAQVLLFGDLAKTGTEQFLAANVVPNTPKSTVAGTVVTRVVVAENVNGQSTERGASGRNLKNQKGYLALTPLQAVQGWKLRCEILPGARYVALLHTDQTRCR